MTVITGRASVGRVAAGTMQRPPGVERGVTGAERAVGVERDDRTRRRSPAARPRTRPRSTSSHSEPSTWVPEPNVIDPTTSGTSTSGIHIVTVCARRQRPVELVLVPRRGAAARLLDQRLVVIEPHAVDAQQLGGGRREPAGEARTARPSGPPARGSRSAGTPARRCRAPRSGGSRSSGAPRRPRWPGGTRSTSSGRASPRTTVWPLARNSSTAPSGTGRTSSRYGPASRVSLPVEAIAGRYRAPCGGSITGGDSGSARTGAMPQSTPRSRQSATRASSAAGSQALRKSAWPVSTPPEPSCRPDGSPTKSYDHVHRPARAAHRMGSRAAIGRVGVGDV